MVFIVETGLSLWANRRLGRVYCHNVSDGFNF